MVLLRASNLAFCASLLGFTSMLFACGARTGLKIPDVETIEDVPNPPDVRDVVQPDDGVCVPFQVPLLRQGAEVMFLIDRSGSMLLDLEGRTTTLPNQRWTLLFQALQTTLPMFANSVETGAVLFPITDRPSLPDSLTARCGAMLEVNVPPAFSNAASILGLSAATPRGPTPTYNAIQTAGDYLLARRRPDRTQYMVLATDGGPNCNDSLDQNTCVCSVFSNVTIPLCRDFPEQRLNCLDDTRTIRAVANFQSRGLPTFVVGIDDRAHPETTTAVLNQMAIAGGRPNTQPVGERFYSVRQAGDLERALGTIQRSIDRCSLVGMVPELPGRRVTLQVDGRTIARDTTRMNGWDYLDPQAGTVAVFGAACDTLAQSPSNPTARVECEP